MYLLLLNKNILDRTYNLVKSKNIEEANVYDLNSYNIKEEGIREYKDVIYFNDIKYVI